MNTVRWAQWAIARHDVKPGTPVSKPPVIATAIFNTVVPLCFIFFAWHHAVAFFHTLRISNLILLTTVVLTLQFYVRKSTASFVSTSAYAWLIALGGTVVPLMFRPTADTADFSAATLMQLLGAAMLVYIFRTFNRGRETTFARCGIKGDGLYRLVRHPLCLALIFSEYGYLLNHTSFFNLFVCIFAIFFQLLRVSEEERLLLDDEEFQGYVKQTPWQVIPWVF